MSMDKFHFYLAEKEQCKLNLETSNFLRKLLASLFQFGVREIPFSGTSYNAGVQAIQKLLEKMLDEDAYDKISDAFIKTPVQEEYNQFQDMLIELNGDVIGFSSMKNPYWRTLSINMTPYYAERILNEPTELKLSRDQFSTIADSFCHAAGVVVWGKF